MEARLHLLAQQLQRTHDPFVRNEPTAVQFGKDTAETELLLQPGQTIKDHVRRADDRPAAQRLVVSDRLQPLGALDASRRVEDAGAIR